MPLTVLFWNVHGQAPIEAVGRMADRRAADVVILDECPLSSDEFAPRLEAVTSGGFARPDVITSRFAVAVRPATARMKEIGCTVHRELVFWELRTAAAELLLVTVHLPAKNDNDDPRQAQMAVLWSERIRDVEDRVMGHRRTVVVGDLNMAPWAPGVAGEMALHAYSNSRLAESYHDREARGPRPAFFNPMWQFLCDHPTRPPGTFHGPRWPLAWHLLDQVLVRPELVPHLAEVDILTTDGVETWVDERMGLASTAVSDHLPILFKLDL
jgi:endonuclease/exonuclease/phosphatase family metal-dependent hydrolase